MSKLYGILIVLLLIYGGYKLILYWDKVSREKDNPKVELTGDALPGMASKLTPSYQLAVKGGAPVIKKWLEQNANSPDLQDPRKAWIQLDYVVLLGREGQLAEAKRLFAEVKARVEASSPVYPRIQKLAATYN